MKKILLVSGCSMVDPNYVCGYDPKVDTSYPKWPELLAKKLDMDCINVGQSGAGNEYIYSTLLEKILEKKDQIGLVIASWSQCQRKDYQDGGLWKNKRIDPQGDIFSWLKKSLRYMISFQTVCEKYNIPYKQFQMISLFDGWINGLFKTENEMYKNRYNKDFEKFYKYPGDKINDSFKCSKILTQYEPYINVKNFIGWPTIENLGGYNVESEVMRDSDSELIQKYTIDKWDQHPNEWGHRKIAEFLYDRLG